MSKHELKATRLTKYLLAAEANAFIPLRAPGLHSDSKKPASEAEQVSDGESEAKRQATDSFSIKDNIATLGNRTTCASRTLKDYHSPLEASVVKRLKAERPVGNKTNMDEFGMGSHSATSFWGAVHNIGRLEERSPGGSSGGSAISVASGAAKISLGSDTGGSVRLPAAYTGVIGFKPSYGMVSRFGLIPYANSLDTVGFLGRDSSHIYPSLSNIALYDPLDPTSISRRTRFRANQASLKMSKENRGGGREKLRIGFPIEYNIQELSPIVKSVWRYLLKKLRAMGHSIIPVSLPSTKHALSAYYILAPAEASSNLAKYDGIRYGCRSSGSDATGGVLYAQSRGENFGPEVKSRILLGSYSLSSDAIDNYFLQAQKIRRMVQNDFDRVFRAPNPLRDPQQFDLSDMDESVVLKNKLGPEQVDVILCPTAPDIPPKLSHVLRQDSLDAYINDVFTIPASLAGLPALTIPFPIQRFESVHPVNSIGIQLIGQYGEDFFLLTLGSEIHELARNPSHVFRKISMTEKEKETKTSKPTEESQHESTVSTKTPPSDADVALAWALDRFTRTIKEPSHATESAPNNKLRVRTSKSTHSRRVKPTRLIKIPDVLILKESKVARPTPAPVSSSTRRRKVEPQVKKTAESQPRVKKILAPPRITRSLVGDKPAPFTFRKQYGSLVRKQGTTPRLVRGDYRWTPLVEKQGTTPKLVRKDPTAPRLVRRTSGLGSGAR